MDDIPLAYVPLFSYKDLVAQEGLRPKQPDAGGDVPRLPDEIWVLAERCWSHVPSDRPLAQDIRDALKQISNSTSPVTSPPATLTGESPSMVLPSSKRFNALFPDAFERAGTLLIASDEIRQNQQAGEQKDVSIRPEAKHLAQEAEQQAQEESAREEMAVEAVRKQKAEIRAAKEAEEKREREHAARIAEAVSKEEVSKREAENRASKEAEENREREHAVRIAEAVRKEEVRKQEAENRAAKAAEEKREREHATKSKGVNARNTQISKFTFSPS